MSYRGLLRGGHISLVKTSAKRHEGAMLSASLRSITQLEVLSRVDTLFHHRRGACTDGVCDDLWRGNLD